MSLETFGAERSLLSILCHHPDKYFTVNDIIDEGDFSSLAASLVFGVIKGLITSGDRDVIDTHVIMAEAERIGVQDFLRHTLNGEFVSAIVLNRPNPANLDKYAADIKCASIKRSLISKCDDIKDEIENHTGSPIELRDMVENSIVGTLDRIDAGEKDIISLSDDFEQTINEYANHAGDFGIDIGLPLWQEDIGHIRNGAITGIFASTKVGKSQLSMHAAFRTAIIQRLPSLYLDTELQPRQQQMRLCGIITGIPYNVIESGEWKNSRAMIDRLKEAFSIVKGAPLYYKNIAGLSVHGVIPTIRKFVYQYLGGKVIGDKPKGLVVYDYIKLMDLGDLSKNVQEYQLIGILLSQLHDCAAKHNIPIIALGQLNKQEDIGIRRIVENVDSATILRPKKREEMEEDGPDRGTHVLEVKYCRHGPGHSFNEWVNLFFDKSCGQFKEDKRSTDVVTTVKIVRDLYDEGSARIARLSDVREE